MIAPRLNWPDDARLMARQLGGAWLCGSVLMGTVAWLFLGSERTVVPLRSGFSPSALPAPAACLDRPRGLACLYPSFFQRRYALAARAGLGAQAVQDER